jgi:hypothetical protein
MAIIVTTFFPAANSTPVCCSKQHAGDYWTTRNLRKHIIGDIRGYHGGDCEEN